MEGFPLFAGAMVCLDLHYLLTSDEYRILTLLLQIAGNYAKLSTSDLNFAAAEYIGARIVYTALYMSTKSEAMSYLRTGAYVWSLAAPVWILWKAGVKMRDRHVEGDGKVL